MRLTLHKVRANPNKPLLTDRYALRRLPIEPYMQRPKPCARSTAALTSKPQKTTCQPLHHF